MALVVVRPGASTTVQDRGRPGYRGFGVPAGGASDRASLDLANALVGNDPDAAALELTLFGGTFRAEVPLALALAGAPMSTLIRASTGPDRSIFIPQSFAIRAGEELVIGGSPFGARAYLAVRGGWQTPLVLGARSGERRIEAGETLPAEAGETPVRRPAGWPWSILENSGPIRVIEGPDSDPEGIRLLESDSYLVSARSDRMGMRLEGPEIPSETDPHRPSAPVAPGAIQVAGGQPIILGVAGGTMGGYRHLAHVVSADLDRLGQFRPGDRASFRRVEVEDARRLDRADRLDRARWLAMIRVGSG